MNKKRILLIASYDGSLISFRGDFIKHLIANQFEVFAAAPNFKEKVSRQLKEMGAKPIEYKLQRTGLNPFKDFGTIMELKSIIKNNKIDLVFPYTVKPVIYGSIASNLNKTSVISLITGLGYTFSGVTTKAKLLQWLNEILYKFSIRKNKIIVFQNKDDHELFLNRKIIAKSQKVEFVSGSGVNLNEYKFLKKKVKEEVSFLLVARLIKEKGISLYMEAATILKKKYPKVEFHLIGPIESAPTAITEDEINDLHNKNIINYHGLQKNIAEHLHQRDVFVLPSYYREGLPRTNLEACACGNPIITTDSVGCRESVKHGINGLLIEPRNLNALINAMEFFITHPEKIIEMGENSRKYAEERFDVNIINSNLLSFINQTLSN
ncbi:glycosyltransferase involved in cell wall biosynthesis [Winogradskyella epiphytica]|uniref:Glycosyltransferase involved in cell wall biosynthesis n=1 Tax=Winogradskyella epiphytica TaxID=262005 RepID=A0A2V4XTL8_9FLAO|nr:glycosyltransferase family 4 protein [Winogradskyella epiphytica]PYE81711.1 glycosyltransferase involved in cell wall biosynthesis [Winogradskyella epiphytica]GGW63217.1 glycosyl transferase [Winogradskyella epiphytica]